MRLVIVESPKKARTIKGFLGAGYQVAASMGHMRDLPAKELGVDIEHDFAPQYVTLPRAQSALTSLRKAASGAETVLLATDPDREGEAIAWHLAQALRLAKSRYRRITFHEISRSAIQAALASPRDLDSHLIDAQQARRVLDRLVGYQLSPLLWRKVQRGTSAGRVQSVAVRLIVDREREIQSFVPEEYWTIDVRLSTDPSDVTLSTAKNPSSFLARLKEIDGKKADVSNVETAGLLNRQLEESAYRVRNVAEKTVNRNPFPPFTTSTLQQAAGNRLRLPAKKTMSLAQGLYEAGLITYMRTDSVAISPAAIAQVRRVVESTFGAEYLPSSPRRYATRAKNAQEAHEAIRPVHGDQAPASLRARLSADEWRVYDLIWKRTVASQMAPARYHQRTALIDGVYVGGDLPLPLGEGRGEGSGGVSTNTNAALTRLRRPGSPRAGRPEGEASSRRFLLRATASTLVFSGWLKVYGEDGGTGNTGGASGSAGQSDEEEAPNAALPDLDAGQTVYPEEVLPAQHFTQPPRRFTEPALVKALEDAGVGRPSTYAAVVSTIQDRTYVRLEQRHFVPTDLGYAANDFLVAHFPKIVDLPFTAQMEDALDEIAGGRLLWTEMLRGFYGPFRETVSAAAGAPVTALKVGERAAGDAAPGSQAGEMAQPRGRGFPTRDTTRGTPALAEGRARRPRSRPQPTEAPVASEAACPQCGKPLVQRSSQYGAFLGCSGYPSCRFIQRDGAPRPAPRSRRRSTAPAPRTTHVVRARRTTRSTRTTRSPRKDG